MHSNSKKPLVSIGLPTYNRPDFLERALSFFRHQSYPHIEVIVSDDCYPGNENRLICEQQLAAGLNVKYSRPEKNLGGPKNHKEVLFLASGEYFFWASDDDLWDKEFISSGVAALEAHPDFSGWMPSFVNTNNNNEIIRHYPLFTRFSSENKLFNCIKFLIEPESLGKCLIVHGIYRRQILLDYVMQYFWDRGRPWMDNSFAYGLHSRLKILFSEQVLLYKCVFDSLEDPQNPSLVSWKNYSGPELNELWAYTLEHAIAASGLFYKTLPFIAFPLRVFLNIAFRLRHKIVKKWAHLSP